MTIMANRVTGSVVSSDMPPFPLPPAPFTTTPPAMALCWRCVGQRWAAGSVVAAAPLALLAVAPSGHRVPSDTKLQVAIICYISISNPCHSTGCPPNPTPLVHSSRCFIVRPHSQNPTMALAAAVHIQNRCCGCSGCKRGEEREERRRRRNGRAGAWGEGGGFDVGGGRTSHTGGGRKTIGCVCGCRCRPPCRCSTLRALHARRDGDLTLHFDRLPWCG